MRLRRRQPTALEAWQACVVLPSNRMARRLGRDIGGMIRRDLHLKQLPPNLIVTSVSVDAGNRFVITIEATADHMYDPATHERVTDINKRRQ